MSAPSNRFVATLFRCASYIVNVMVVEPAFSSQRLIIYCVPLANTYEYSIWSDPEFPINLYDFRKLNPAGSFGTQRLHSSSALHWAKEVNALQQVIISEI